MLDNLTEEDLKITVQKENVIQSFARHETFHPRFGWLKKGFDKAQENPEIFSKDNATIALGVGKNMVTAIRYWSIAFKILDSQTPSGKRLYKPTEFGKKLFSDKGWDPYLEDQASLWLLHWNLLKPPCEAASWYFAFNEFRLPEFTIDDIFESLLEYKENHFPNISSSSLKKDINCILRMYIRQNNNVIKGEDSLDCPFTDLNLIQSSNDARYYTFNIGSKAGLKPEIIVATCLEYIAMIKEESSSISISRLLYDIGSPGIIFKLTETALYDAIDQVHLNFENITYKDSAGLIKFVYEGNPTELADKILDGYYSRR